MSVTLNELADNSWQVKAYISQLILLFVHLSKVVNEIIICNGFYNVYFYFYKQYWTKCPDLDQSS